MDTERVFVWAERLIVGDRLRIHGHGVCRVVRIEPNSCYPTLRLVECERVRLLDRLRERLTSRWFAYGH